MTNEELLRRKVERRIKNQSGFLKHGSIYAVLFIFYFFISIMTRSNDFRMGFGIVFLLWGIGLTIHFLSAFVFNRINSWKETKFQRELNKLQLNNPSLIPDLPEEDMDDWDEELELRDFQTIKQKDTGKSYSEGDFV
nr:2TM domain-containing protein [Membranihabitans marinus]